MLDDNHHSPSSLYLSQQNVTQLVARQMIPNRHNNNNSKTISKLWILFCESLREDLIDSLRQKVDFKQQTPVSLSLISLEIPSIGLLEIHFDKLMKSFVSPSANFTSFLVKNEKRSRSRSPFSTTRARSNSPKNSRSRYEEQETKSPSSFVRSTFNFQKFTTVVQTIFSLGGGIEQQQQQQMMSKDDIMRIIRLCFEVVLCSSKPAILDLTPIGSLHATTNSSSNQHRSWFHLSREFSDELLEILQNPSRLFEQKDLVNSSSTSSSFISRARSTTSSSCCSRNLQKLPLRQNITNVLIQKSTEEPKSASPPLLTRKMNNFEEKSSLSSSSSLAVKSSSRKTIEEYLKKKKMNDEGVTLI
jgi:hypothetical protein